MFWKKEKKEQIAPKREIEKKVFIINGSGGVGKDTFVNMVGKYIKVINYSSVKKIKEIAMQGGWNGSKTEKDRKFLSDLKFLFSEYNDLPFEDMKSIYGKFLSVNSKEKCLFLHIREPEEIERAKQAFEARTILVSNKNVEDIKSNAADANVLNYSYDIEVKNDGTLGDLEDTAKLFIKDEVFGCKEEDVDCLECFWGYDDDEGIYCGCREKE